MKNIKNYLLIIILCIASFICGVTINSVHASINKVSTIQNVENVQRVSYDYVYVNGTRYIVFMSSTGDIEVVR